jgi:hypothetical protein
MYMMSLLTQMSQEKQTEVITVLKGKWCATICAALGYARCAVTKLIYSLSIHMIFPISRKWFY